MKFNEYQARVLNSIATVTGKGYFETVDALKALKRYASTLHRLDENACNGWPKPVTEIREGKTYRYSVEDTLWRYKDEKKEESVNKKVEQLAKNMGWTFERQGDPRGFPFYVKVTIDNREVNIADIIA